MFENKMYLIIVITSFLGLFSFGLCTVEEFFTREKCVEELGCFYAGSPFFDLLDRPLSLLPDDRDQINTKFYLFTPKNLSPKFLFRNFDKSLNKFSSSGFDPKLETKFVIAGFMSRYAAYWKMPLIENLLQSKECNVFLVDWHGGDGPLYEQAVANARLVGAEIAQFIKNIQAITGISLNTIHLIGHSLGSHIAGYAGKRLHKIGRITALDPAGPYFTGVDPVVRLDKSDALFVDAIHTNAAPSRLQGFGLIESVGHFDFWPNGGHLQPGCPDMGSSILAFLSHPSLNYDGLHEIMCNHVRAIDMFISSMSNSNCDLSGIVCDSWEAFFNGKCDKNAKIISMGLHADKFTKYIDTKKSLNIYLSTTDKQPYCVN